MLLLAGCQLFGGCGLDRFCCPMPGQAAKGYDHIHGYIAGFSALEVLD